VAHGIHRAAYDRLRSNDDRRRREHDQATGRTPRKHPDPYQQQPARRRAARGSPSLDPSKKPQANAAPGEGAGWGWGAVPAGGPNVSHPTRARRAPTNSVPVSDAAQRRTQLSVTLVRTPTPTPAAQASPSLLGAAARHPEGTRTERLASSCRSPRWRKPDPPRHR
jgi:hypothetical protein